MTQVSSIHAALVTLASGLLTTRRRLANPYDLGACNGLQLANGFGVAIGPATNSQRHISGSATLIREFRVVLTTQATAKDTDGAARGEIEKSLMEAAITLTKAVESDPDLSETAMNCVYAGDSGIEFVEGTTDGPPAYYKTEITLQIEYRESLT